MEEQINTLICGAGGIGSFLCPHLDRLIDTKQIKNLKFTFYDDDKVETKNILYQNFRESDVHDYKTEALSNRYFNLNFKNKRVNISELQNYDLVILCADNNVIRREAYENYTLNRIPFIDSRANGRAIGIFSSDTENYLDTIDKSSDASSCQDPFQLSRKEIEFGNVVVAAYLAQCILNYDRRKILPYDFMVNI